MIEHYISAASRLYPDCDIQHVGHANNKPVIIIKKEDKKYVFGTGADLSKMTTLPAFQELMGDSFCPC